MALALNNAQGELHPLEIGWHALGFLENGGTVRAYADALGDRSKERHITYMVAAAKVVAHVCDAWAAAFDGTPEAQMEALNALAGDSGKNHWRALAELHPAPRWLWRSLVSRLVSEGWTVEQARGAAQRQARQEASGRPSRPDEPQHAPEPIRARAAFWRSLSGLLRRLGQPLAGVEQRLILLQLTGGLKDAREQRLRGGVRSCGLALP
jgi:hypothetical protein